MDSAAYASPWRCRHPAEKALLAFGLLGCAIALPPWPGALIVAVVATAILLGPAKISMPDLGRAATVPLLFVITGAIPLLVTIGDSPIVRWNPAGPAAAAQLVGRAMSALLCLLLFAATTPLADVLPRLSRLGVPPAVTEIAVLIYRMVFLLMDTARSVREAQAARLGYRTLRGTYQSLAGQGAAIFIQAYDRARRMEEGLALRGYDGSLRVDIQERRISVRFVTASLGLLAMVIASTRALYVMW